MFHAGRIPVSPPPTLGYALRMYAASRILGIVLSARRVAFSFWLSRLSALSSFHAVRPATISKLVSTYDRASSFRLRFDTLRS